MNCEFRCARALYISDLCCARSSTPSGPRDQDEGPSAEAVRKEVHGGRSRARAREWPQTSEIPQGTQRVLRRGEAVREEVRGGVSVRVLANGLERILERLAPDVDIRSRRGGVEIY